MPDFPANFVSGRLLLVGWLPEQELVLVLELGLAPGALAKLLDLLAVFVDFPAEVVPVRVVLALLALESLSKDQLPML